ANILDSDQHSDPIAGQFFQRIRFDISDLTTDRGSLERAIAEVAGRFGMTYALRYASAIKRVAILVSRHDHCLYDLLLRHRSGEPACVIPIIASNHPDLGNVAAQFAVPFHALPVTDETRPAQEARILELLEAERIDLVVLARYMQVLGPALLGR